MEELDYKTSEKNGRKFYNFGIGKCGKASPDWENIFTTIYLTK